MPPSQTEPIRRVIEEFIELYRSLPCLWKVRSKEYYNRGKKAAAYKLLVEKLKQIDPFANKDAVVRKINSLRSNVRKERKKHEKSLKSATTDEDIYHIKLWYYDLMSFLTNKDIPTEPSCHLDSDNNSCEEEPSTAHQDISNEDQKYQNHLHWESAIDDEHQSEASNPISPKSDVQIDVKPNYVFVRSPSQRKSSKRSDELRHGAMDSLRDHFKRPCRITTEDRCDIIGKNVTLKLRALDKKYVSVAEKLINDLLYEAEIGNLTPDHAYINIRDVLKQHRA